MSQLVLGGGLDRLDVEDWVGFIRRRCFGMVAEKSPQQEKDLKHKRHNDTTST